MSGLRELYQQELCQNANESDLATWEFHYKALLDQLEGDLEQKEAIIRKRILRYFGQFKLEEDGYFSDRI